MVNTRWYSEKGEQSLRDAVKENKSLAGVLKQLGLIPAGGNYQHLKYHINRLELDISHFTGQGHMIDHYTQPNNTYNRTTAKRFLINKRGHQCETCKYKMWNEKPIPLELEHTDGDNNNNDEANLLLLCCNCHAQTKTWRRRKK